MRNQNSHGPKRIVLFIAVIALVACKQNEDLSSSEEELIKKEIMASLEKHFNDLRNLDYSEAMTFYAEDHILFADGKYLGGYEIVDAIWNSALSNWREIYKFDIKSHHVHLFSSTAASYLVEIEHERIESNGDTTKLTGCGSYGMQKFPDGWKAVTQNIVHNHLKGYNPNEK